MINDEFLIENSNKIPYYLQTNHRRLSAVDVFINIPKIKFPSNIFCPLHSPYSCSNTKLSKSRKIDPSPDIFIWVNLLNLSIQSLCQLHFIHFKTVVKSFPQLSIYFFPLFLSKCPNIFFKIRHASSK